MVYFSVLDRLVFIRNTERLDPSKQCFREKSKKLFYRYVPVFVLFKI